MLTKKLIKHGGKLVFFGRGSAGLGRGPILEEGDRGHRRWSTPRKFGRGWGAFGPLVPRPPWSLGPRVPWWFLGCPLASWSFGPLVIWPFGPLVPWPKAFFLCQNSKIVFSVFVRHLLVVWGVGRSLKSLMEVVRRILAKFRAKRSHGDPNRTKSSSTI